MTPTLIPSKEEVKPENTGEIQVKRTKKDTQFKKGHSGNPAGKPKGALSIKAQILTRLKKNPKELKEIVDYFIKDNRDLMWQMLEGRPPQQVDLSGQIEEKQIRELILTTRQILELPNVSKSNDIIVGEEPIQE